MYPKARSQAEELCPAPLNLGCPASVLPRVSPLRPAGPLGTGLWEGQPPLYFAFWRLDVNFL